MFTRVKESKESQEVILQLLKAFKMNRNEPEEINNCKSHILSDSNRCPKKIIIWYSYRTNALVMKGYIQTLLQNTGVEELILRYQPDPDKHWSDAKKLGKYWDQNLVFGKIIPTLTQVLRKSQIRFLDLSHNRITENLVSFVKCWDKSKGNNQLEGLNLQGNTIGDYYLKDFALENFRSGSRLWRYMNLKRFHVNYKELPPCLEIKLLTQWLRRVPVRILNLEHTGLSWPDIQMIVKVLPETQVEQLNLADNNIGDRAFINLLSSQYSGFAAAQLRYLNLRYNKVSDTGAEAFARFLPKTSIQFLMLKDFYGSYIPNRISDRMSERIVEILQKNKARQKREEFYWGYISLVIAFRRANSTSSIKDSIFDVAKKMLDQVRTQHLKDVPLPRDGRSMLTYWSQFVDPKQSPKLEKFQQDRAVTVNRPNYRPNFCRIC